MYMGQSVPQRCDEITFAYKHGRPWLFSAEGWRNVVRSTA